MAAVVGSLMVELLADNTKLNKALSAAGHDVTGLERRSNASLGRMDARFSGTFATIGKGSRAAFATLATAAAGVLVPLLSVSAALNGAKQAISEFDAIGKTAKTIGLTAEALQEIRYAAGLAGVSVTDLDTSMIRLARTLGEAQRGKTSQVKLFEELGVSIRDAEGRARSVNDVFTDVARAISAIKDPARSVALTMEAFGRSGARMARFLGQGAEKISELRDRARELGIVVKDDLIARAEDLNDAMSTASQIADLQFKQTLIDLMPILVATTGLVGDLAKAINLVVDQMRSIQDRVLVRPLQNQLVDIENRIYALKQGIAKDEANIAALGAGNPSAAMLNFSLPGKKEELEALYQSALALQDRIAQLQGMGKTPPVATLEGDTVDAGAADAAAKAAINQAESVAKLIENLRFEQDQLGRTAAEQELYNLLKSAGVDRESEFGQSIETALDSLQSQRAALDESRKAIEANAAAMEEFGSLAKDILSGFISDLRQGESFTYALGDAFGRLGDRLLDIALDQAITGFLGMISGGLSGLNFTPALSGFKTGLPLSYAGGGYTGNGPRLGGIDGMGGFPAILHPQETVVDHTVLQSANQNATPSFSITIGAIKANSEAEGAAAARGVMKVVRKEFPTLMEEYNSNSRRRIGG